MNNLPASIKRKKRIKTFFVCPYMPRNVPESFQDNYYQAAGNGPPVWKLLSGAAARRASFLRKAAVYPSQPPHTGSISAE